MVPNGVGSGITPHTPMPLLDTTPPTFKQGLMSIEKNPILTLMPRRHACRPPWALNLPLDG